jgi:hypothetical protein
VSSGDSDNIIFIAVTYTTSLEKGLLLPTATVPPETHLKFPFLLSHAGLECSYRTSLRWQWKQFVWTKVTIVLILIIIIIAKYSSSGVFAFLQSAY